MSSYKKRQNGQHAWINASHASTSNTSIIPEQRYTRTPPHPSRSARRRHNTELSDTSRLRLLDRSLDETASSSFSSFVGKGKGRAMAWAEFPLELEPDNADLLTSEAQSGVSE